jgi:hypothetical protein
MHSTPWPLTARRDPDGALVIGDVPAARPRSRDHGSPLWVVDEVDLREPLPRAYVDGVPRGGPSATHPRRGVRRGSCRSSARRGCSVDVASGGELHSADIAGIPMAQVVLHGNAKSIEELARRSRLGVGRIVVDSFVELTRLERDRRRAGHVFDDLAAHHARDRRPHARVRPHRPRRLQVRVHAVAWPRGPRRSRRRSPANTSACGASTPTSGRRSSAPTRSWPTPTSLLDLLARWRERT